MTVIYVRVHEHRSFRGDGVEMWFLSCDLQGHAGDRPRPGPMACASYLTKSRLPARKNACKDSERFPKPVGTIVRVSTIQSCLVHMYGL